MQGEPTHLAALVRWFMDEAAADIPVRLHSRDTAEDGDPEWHASFRSYLMAHPAAVDREGEVRSPFRFWLWIMRGESRQGRVGADFLFRLAYLQGDWLAAVKTLTPLTEDGEVMARVYALSTLQAFWRRMQCEPRRMARAPKSEAQVAAEEAA